MLSIAPQFQDVQPQHYYMPFRSAASHSNSHLQYQQPQYQSPSQPQSQAQYQYQLSQQQQHYTTDLPPSTYYNLSIMGSPTAVGMSGGFNSSNCSSRTASQSHSQPTQQQQQQQQHSQDASVNQALEIARESPDGANDPTISRILEAALSQIWNKVEAQPDDYVMTRDEFAVFNFFQHRFTGNRTAMSARRRFWEKSCA
ncbi:hypothetical protein G7046_g9155 [Stylonectria norvegica]|nr:hypothetical protein G7046_g9155 [Stylonectria norvegica]